MLNIDNIIDKFSATVKSHRLENTGEYRRWLWQDDTGERNLGINEYGCADAANILYTIGEFPSDLQERSAWISVLQGLQNKETGLFTEETHHPVHTTAHCTAALNLFDAKPLYPMNELMKYTTKEALYDFLENLPWLTDPWNGSHRGAGLYAALVLTDSVSEEWSNEYFDWMWENADPDTGLIGKKWIKDCQVPLFCNLASSFHYLFNHEYARMPIRYPDKMIDTCLRIYETDYAIGNYLDVTNISFSMVDWVYCINRASRQTPYRFDDCKRALKTVATDYITFLYDLDEKTHERFNDLHMLFGCTCAIAEFQQALPGFIKSRKPLRLVLDRRPFI